MAPNKKEEKKNNRNGHKKCEIFKAKCHIKMTYLLVSSGGLGWVGRKNRSATRWKIVKRGNLWVEKKRGALDACWLGTGILPSSSRSDSRELHCPGCWSSFYLYAKSSWD